LVPTVMVEALSELVLPSSLPSPGFSLLYFIDCVPSKLVWSQLCLLSLSQTAKVTKCHFSSTFQRLHTALEKNWNIELSDST
jgi:hypothetical protein